MVQRFASTAGVSRLAYELMNSTFREPPDVSERSAGGLADALSHLLQLAMLEKSGRPTHLTHRELLRDRIKQYVQTHLRDPDLSIRSELRARFADDAARSEEEVLSSGKALELAATFDYLTARASGAKARAWRQSK